MNNISSKYPVISTAKPADLYMIFHYPKQSPGPAHSLVSDTGAGVYQLYRQIQRAHVQNIFYNYLLYPKYSIGGARPHEAGTLSPMSQPSQVRRLSHQS